MSSQVNGLLGDLNAFFVLPCRQKNVSQSLVGEPEMGIEVDGLFELNDGVVVSPSKEENPADVLPNDR